MSFNPMAALMVADLLQYLPKSPAVIEFGNQTFKAGDEALKKIIEQFGQNPSVNTAALQSLIGKGKVAGSTEAFYHALGFSFYAAIDVNNKYGSLMMDLNRDLRSEYNFSQTFDLVTNNGTGEHCFNQYAVFKNMHDLAKVGGVMFHAMPLNWVNHGFYNFNPRLYADLATANSYKILYFGLNDRRGLRISACPQDGGDHGERRDSKGSWKNPLRKFLRTAFRNTRPSEAKPSKHTEKFLAWEIKRLLRLKDLHNLPKVFIVVALKKVADHAFVAPIQGKYKHTIESPEIQKRYAGLPHGQND